MHGQCGHTVHSHLAEAVIINRLKKYIDEYNSFIVPLDVQIELYACHMHSDFQILKNSEIKLELKVQVLKTGATVVDTFTYYWPENFPNLVWKKAHMLADLCRTVPCHKCHKTAFQHMTSHFTDRIRPHLYNWADTWLRKGFRQNPHH